MISTHRTFVLALVSLLMACGHKAEPPPKKQEGFQLNRRAVSLGSATLSEEVLANLGKCVDDDGDACVKASNAYVRGRGAPVDIKRASLFLETPCNQGNAHACFRRGFLGMVAEPSVQTQANADVYYQKACNIDATFCAHYGQHLMRDRKKITEARALLKKACDAGGARGCRALAFEYLWDVPLTQSHPEYERLSIKACTLEGLSETLCRGMLVERLLQKPPKEIAAKDDTKTLGGLSFAPKTIDLKALQQRCEKDEDGEACLNLGSEKSKSAPKEAATFFEQGCQLGVPQACQKIADAYFSGAGVKRHHGHGTLALQRTCAVSEGQGCASLARWYSGRSRKPRAEKFAEAMIWMNAGCAAFEAKDCNDLQGVKENVRWMGLVGCSSKNQKTCRELPKMGINGVEDTFAQKLARQACVLGSGDACAKSASLLLLDKREDEAMLFAQFGCARGKNARPCTIAAHLSLKRGDKKESHRFFAKACKRSAYSCGSLAAAIAKDTFTFSRLLAVRSFFSDAVYAFSYEVYFEDCRHNPKGCGLWAHARLYGEGTERDTKPALALLQKLCADNNDDCLTVAGMKEIGHYLKEDKASALSMANDACRRDEAHCALARRLQYQSTKKKEEGERYLALIKARCEDDERCGLFAEELIKGELIEQDVERARTFIDTDCEAYGGTECLTLAQWLIKAEGTQNLRDAHRYLMTSCYQHNPAACEVWFERLEDGTFEPQKYELRDVLTRGCLEDVQSHCKKFDKRFGLVKKYEDALKKQLLKKGGLVSGCREKNPEAAAAFYFEIAPSKDATFYEQQTLNAKAHPEFADCVLENLKKMSFDTPPARADIWLVAGDIDDSVIRSPPSSK